MANRSRCLNPFKRKTTEVEYLRLRKELESLKSEIHEIRCIAYEAGWVGAGTLLDWLKLKLRRK